MQTFQIQPMVWSKRRKLAPTPEPIKIDVRNFKKEVNHFCEAIVEYSDGSRFELLARVLHNDIKNTWMVNGLDDKGHSISAKLIE